MTLPLRFSRQSRLKGLIAAAVTPMRNDGSLNLEMVPGLTEYLEHGGVRGLYICGSTGEGLSLTIEERKSVAEAFVDAAGGRLRTIVQVGHTSLLEAQRLAAHAQEIGADCFSATAPFYYELKDAMVLTLCIQEVACAAPELPFYYYHIPDLVRVNVDMVDFLTTASEKIPNLVGMKFTAPELEEYQACLELNNGEFDLLWGLDEMLLGALATGCRGAVGSTYNIAAPIYRKMMAAFDQGDIETARNCQSLSVKLVRLVAGYPFFSALKEIMRMNGIDCGCCRLPQARLTIEQIRSLRSELESIGYFRWAQQEDDPVESA